MLFIADKLYPESEVLQALGVTRRWLRRHIRSRSVGRKTWYLGADLSAAMTPRSLPSHAAEEEQAAKAKKIVVPAHSFSSDRAAVLHQQILAAADRRRAK